MITIEYLDICLIDRCDHMNAFQSLIDSIDIADFHLPFTIRSPGIEHT